MSIFIHLMPSIVAAVTRRWKPVTCGLATAATDDNLVLAHVVCAFSMNASESPLADAVENKNRDTAIKLLKQKSDANTPQVDGTTALHWAAYHDDAELGLMLLEAGARARCRKSLRGDFSVQRLSEWQRQTSDSPFTAWCRSPTPRCKERKPYSPLPELAPLKSSKPCSKAARKSTPKTAIIKPP